MKAEAKQPQVYEKLAKFELEDAIFTIEKGINKLAKNLSSKVFDQEVSSQLLVKLAKYTETLEILTDKLKDIINQRFLKSLERRSK